MFPKTWLFKKNVLVLKYDFEDTFKLVTYKKDIKDALHFTLVVMEVSQIFSKMTFLLTANSL